MTMMMMKINVAVDRDLVFTVLCLHSVMSKHQSVLKGLIKLTVLSIIP